MSAASIAAEVEGVGGSACQCSDHTPHTASNWSTWLSSQKETSSKDDAQESPQTVAEDKQTKDMDYWNQVLWSDETNINVRTQEIRVWRQPGEEFKDKCVFPTVKHGGGFVVVWGCMSAAGTGELQFIEGTMNGNMSKAEHDPLPSETGPQGSIPTW